MFEKYSEKARRALFFGRYEASKFGSQVIESEHILLGILREGEDTVTAILKHYHVTSDEIRRELEGDRVFAERVSSTAELPLSEASKKILAYASHEAESMLQSNVGTAHLLIGILRVQESLATKVLVQHGLELASVREIVLEASLYTQSQEAPFIAEYCTDLTLMAAQGALDPLIGRDELLDEMIQSLCLRSKNNPLLIGEIGSGRKSIVHGLAHRIGEGAVPLRMLGKRILQLDFFSLVAGAKYRGQFEERLNGLVKALRENSNVIIFIDDLHAFFRPDNSTVGASAMLHPHLLANEIQCIGVTTPSGYRSHLESDPIVRYHFFRIDVGEPSAEATLQILQSLRGRYEEHHGVVYTDDAIKAALDMSQMYITDRVLPEKAVYLLDASGARLNATTLAPEHLRRAQGQISNASERLRKAIADGAFDRAATLRNQLTQLHERLGRFSKTRQELEGSSASPPVVTRQIVEEVAASYSQECTSAAVAGVVEGDGSSAIATLTLRLAALEQELNNVRSRANPLTPLVFISYAREDYQQAGALHEELTRRGFRAWMDKKDMLGGKKWELELRRMIKKADFILICLSNNAVRKRGFIQAEMHLALEVAKRRPPGEISVVPLRLESSLDDDAIPAELAEFHYINLFEEGAIERVVASIAYQFDRLGYDGELG